MHHDTAPSTPCTILSRRVIGLLGVIALLVAGVLPLHRATALRQRQDRIPRMLGR
jgi:hypothetical protein